MQKKKKSVWKEYDVTVRSARYIVVRVKARNPGEAMQKAVKQAPDIDTELEAEHPRQVSVEKSLTFEDIHTFQDYRDPRTW